MHTTNPSLKLPIRISADACSRSSKGQLTSDREKFSFPPPPMRTRKIIQMKPRPQENHIGTGRQAASKGACKISPSPATTGKKKQRSATTSAAGRKSARKTAHCLIERRRRSKMSEEFGILRDMIPACKDQEMPKLAILQVRRAGWEVCLYADERATKASSQYLRYLEQCITELKMNLGDGADNSSPSTQPLISASQHASSASSLVVDDVEMFKVSEKIVLAGSPHHRFYKYQQIPNNNVAYKRQFQPPSILPSPAVEPQPYSYPVSHTFSLSASPALNPQKENTTDLDHEATARLMMLNSDRSSHGRRSMSVKDLLSS